MLTTYTHPKSFPRSREITLNVNGEPVEVLSSDLADFAICTLTEAAAEVVITANTTQVKSASIHPQRLGVAPEVENNATVSFTLERAQNVLVQMPGLRDLYLYIHDRAEAIPEDPKVLRIPAGQIVETARLDLKGHTGLHIEGGAVLRGRIWAQDIPDLRISGHGIFDGSYYSRDNGDCIPSIILERCENCRVEDITMVNPSGWMLLLGASNGAHVQRLKQLGKVMSSDGIDVVGSSHVLIEDCFLSNNDDCVVIKAFDVGANNLSDTSVQAACNVENVTTRNCVFVNGPGGNGMEVGHELAVDSIRAIRFENIDIVSVHGHGAVFSLHNNDHATIEDVVFENIRIEHCYDKLIDFRISRSRYSTDDERGHIRNVLVKNIDWSQSPFNDGYTISLVGGWDEQHRIEDIRIQNFRINGRPIEHIDELQINTRWADPIQLLS